MVHPDGPVGGGGGTVPEQAPDVQTSSVVPESPSSHCVLSGAFVSAEQTPSVHSPASLQGPEALQTTSAQRSGEGVGVGGVGGGGTGGGLAPQSSTGTTVNVVSPPSPVTSPSDCPPATARSASNSSRT